MARKAEEGATCHRPTDQGSYLGLNRTTALPLIPAGIQTEENKVKKSIKEADKKGQKDVAKILAKELVQSRKAVGKLYASKAQMNSVMMTMQQQVCKSLTSTQ